MSHDHQAAADSTDSSAGSGASGGSGTSEDSGAQAGASRVGGRPGSRRLAKFCIAFVIFHLAMTAVYLAPTPGPIRSVATRYMEPVFKQSWWVFAPDPVSSNVYLSVRGKKADGSMTPWFGITRCDIDSAILHHPVPNRRYLSTFQLMRHYQLWRDNLPQKARDTLTRDVSGADWPTSVRHQLLDAGATPHIADTFLKSDRAMNNLGSAILESRYGKVSGVQVQIKTVHTRPFAQRNTNVPLKTEVWESGTTPFTQAPREELATVDELYGPKGGC